GGGSNGGSGGKGGFQTNNFAMTDNGGLGGRSIDYSANSPRLLMGGGGGGGHENDSWGSKGGRGGGLIIVRAQTLDFSNSLIISNGDSAIEAAVDGAGGGGGGGTIAISTQTIVGNPSLIAIGGRGGNSNPHRIIGDSTHCFAPGGGG